jgi:hypothetical protein
MTELTAQQIADALAGHPGSAEQEMRLLRLFQSNTDPLAEVEAVPIRKPLAKAA